MSTTRTLTRFSAMMVAASAFIILFAALPARADEDVGKEVSTAATHTGLASAAKDMAGIQMHLHHTINCLVGPKGDGFDAGVANPCKDQGNGAIADTKDAAKVASLRQALAKVNVGLKETDMTAAQQAATAAQDLIKKAM